MGWRVAFACGLLMPVAMGCDLILDTDAFRGAEPVPPDAAREGDGDAGAPDDAAKDERAKADQPAASTWRYAFVTSGIFDGTVVTMESPSLPALRTSQQRADYYCGVYANSQGRLAGRRWVAWFSGFESMTSAARRFPTGPDALEYRRVDGQTVFGAGFPSVIQYPLQPLVIDEKGDVAVGRVWTHTQATGESAGGTSGGSCRFNLGDEAGDEFGIVGQSLSTSPEWTDSFKVSCRTKARLYCFEVP